MKFLQYQIRASTPPPPTPSDIPALNKQSNTHTPIPPTTTPSIMCPPETRPSLSWQRLQTAIKQNESATCNAPA